MKFVSSWRFLWSSWHFFVHYFCYTLLPDYFFRQLIDRRLYISRNIVLFMFRDRRTFFANDIFTYLNDVANETNNLPSGLTINGIAASWINRDRVPLVTVIRDYETGKINLTQVSWTKALFPARMRDAGRQTRFSHR